tara:strand:- start:3372 stop:3716 length:345 start_codon:yes stop_codon:yes gene_type:complete
MAERKDEVCLFIGNTLPFSVLEKITESAKFLTTQKVKPIDIFEGKYKEVSERRILVIGQDVNYFTNMDNLTYKVIDKAEIDTSTFEGHIDGKIKLLEIGSKNYTQQEVDELRNK